MEQINERLRSINEIKYGGNVSAMAKDMGISQPSARSYVNENVDPKASALIKLLEANKDINADWLLRGIGEPIIIGNPISGEEDVVPVVSVDLARETNIDVMHFIASNPGSIEYANLNDQMPHYEVVFRAIDNAMDPYISKGDILGMRKVGLDEINEAMVYMMDTPSGCHVRRVFREPGGFILKSSNPKYPHIHIKEEQIYNALLVVIVLRFSLTPAAISLEDIERKDVHIDALNEEKDKLLDETIKYGSRIDKLLDIMGDYQKGVAQQDVRASIAGAV